MASLEGKFNEQTDNPAHKYVGYEGCKRGETEMLNSFYDAFPDYRGHVALVDLRALDEDRAGELARLSSELGVSDIEAAVGKSIEDGEMFSGFNDAGEKIAVAAARSVHKYPSENLTFENNLVLASVAVHELAHAIDYMEGNLRLEEGVLQSNYVESYADSYRIALYVLHGHDDGAKNLISNYDVRQATRVSDRYDNGVALGESYISSKSAAKDIQVNGPIQNFNFDSWKTAKEIADKVRLNNLGRHGVNDSDLEKSEYNWDARRAITLKVRDLMDDGIESQAAHISSRGDSEEMEVLKDAVEYYVNKLDAQAYEDGELQWLDEETLLQVDIAYNVRVQIKDWLEDRRDYIPDADRIVSSYDYLLGKGVFLDYQIPEHDPLVFFAKSMDMYLKEGDRQDLNIAEGAIFILGNKPEYEGTIFNKQSTDDVINFFKEKPEVVKSLAEGMTLDYSLNGVPIILPEYKVDEISDVLPGRAF